MFANQLKIEIEKDSERIARSNPLFIGAREGTLNRSAVITYLFNLKHMFRYSTQMLEVGEKKAREIGNSELAEFYQNKLKEETGHDQWAKNDLKRQGLSEMEAEEEHLNSSTLKLKQYISDCIQENPVLYLSYMTFAEYFTVLVGPELLQNLEKNCGIPISGMTAVGKHIDADEHHSVENFDMIADLVKGVEIEDLFCSSLRRFTDLVDGVIAECVQESN